MAEVNGAGAHSKSKHYQDQEDAAEACVAKNRMRYHLLVALGNNLRIGTLQQKPHWRHSCDHLHCCRRNEVSWSVICLYLCQVYTVGSQQMWSAWLTSKKKSCLPVLVWDRQGVQGQSIKDQRGAGPTYEGSKNYINRHPFVALKMCQNETWRDQNIGRLEDK